MVQMLMQSQRVKGSDDLKRNQCRHQRYKDSGKFDQWLKEASTQTK